VFRQADSGAMKLPLTGNAYLFEVAMQLADKAEAAAEKQHEQGLRSRTHRTDAATAALATKDPALAAIEASRAAATPMPAEVRERLQQLKKGA
jgi:acyl-CoA thioesterase FadM